MLFFDVSQMVRRWNMRHILYTLSIIFSLASGVIPTISKNLMTPGALGNFESDDWPGYTCTFAEWTSCINTSNSLHSCTAVPTCSVCQITKSCTSQYIRFSLPRRGIYPVVEQFTIPPNVHIVGPANPTPFDKEVQQVDVGSHSWFIVPRVNALCGTDPFCRTDKGLTACRGDPRIRRQGFLMSSNTSLININFQGSDLGRAGSEGTLCGPGAIELPGCLSGSSCGSWSPKETTGEGIVQNVLIKNVRLSDAVKRGNISMMGGNCRSGEALDNDGNHVPAHQVSLFVSKLPDSEQGRHRNITVINLVSMNSRADGLNVHGAVDDFTLEDSYIENSGDDCLGIWSTGINRMIVRNFTGKNCAVTAGKQENWGSCMGTYAFQSLKIENFYCYDPFNDTLGCNPRTHFTAIHLNKAFAKDCMPAGAVLSLSGIHYYTSENPTVPLLRPKCGSCSSCCGSCSIRGFNNLTVLYKDDSVSGDLCKKANAGC